MSKKKFYVVLRGYKTGIFTSWEECKKQVDGYPGAVYKSFPKEELAKKAFERGLDPSGRMHKNILPPEVIKDSICVDAACSGNPGNLEYRGVYTATGKEVFHFGPLANGTNNIGEFLAIVYALRFLKEKDNTCPVYSDSEDGILWVKNKKAKTRLEKSVRTEDVWRLIKEAEGWLKENNFKNQILKWETEKWGEIPADFGRK